MAHTQDGPSQERETRLQNVLDLGDGVGAGTESEIMALEKIIVPEGYSIKNTEFIPESELRKMRADHLVDEFEGMYSDVKGFRRCGLMIRHANETGVNPDSLGMVMVRVMIEDTGKEDWKQKYVIVVRIFNGEEGKISGDMAVVDIVSRDIANYGEHKDIVWKHLSNLGLLNWYLENPKKMIEGIRQNIQEKEKILDKMSDNSDEKNRLRNEIGELKEKLDELSDIVDPTSADKVSLLNMMPVMIVGGWVEKKGGKLILKDTSGDFGNVLWGEDVNRLTYSLLKLLSEGTHGKLLVKGHHFLNTLLDSMTEHKRKPDFYKLLAQSLRQNAHDYCVEGQKKVSRFAISGLINMYVEWLVQSGKSSNYIEALAKAQNEIGVIASEK